MTALPHDSMARSVRLGSLRRLFDDSCLLATDPPACPLLARAETFPICGSGASVDCDVDHFRVADVEVAPRRPLQYALDLDSRHFFILDRYLDLLAVWKGLQFSAARRLARGFA